MSITLGVQQLDGLLDEGDPVSVAGLLWVADDEIKLYDWDGERAVRVSDPEAGTALQAALPPSAEYFAEALLFAWVRAGEDGPELHGVYWVTLGGPPRWGPRVTVRPVPAEHNYLR